MKKIETKYFDELVNWGVENEFHIMHHCLIFPNKYFPSWFSKSNYSSNELELIIEKFVLYISSFAGYFPADEPKYSCIVVINRPEISTGFYGNIVAAPVFKDIAMSIHKMTPQINTPTQGYWDDAIQLVTQQNEAEASSKFIRAAEKLEEGKIPNIIGWKSIDAIELFENKKWEIKLQGNGTVIDYKVEKPQKKILIRLG